MPYKNFCFLNIYKADNHYDNIWVFSAYFLIFFSQVFSLIFIDLFLWIEISPAFLFIGFLLTCCIFYNLIICHISEPGALKTGNLQLSLEEILKEKQRKEFNNILRFHTERYCETCKIMRPPKSSHCSTCNHCVKGFDHHCNFIANCVGIRNRSNFLWFLLLTNILIWYRFILGIVTAIIIFQNEEISSSYYDQIHIFIGTFISLGLAFLLLLICQKAATYVFLFFITIAMIFLICGSAIAIHNVDGIKFYEYPIFSLMNIFFHFSSMFFLVPLFRFNFSNASLLITTKEYWSYQRELSFKKETLIKKPEFKFREKILNIFKTLSSPKEKSELL